MKKMINLTYYVSTRGDDNWSGRVPDPNLDGTDGPFATLVRARNVVREHKKDLEMKEPVTVTVRGGEYFLDKTFVLTVADGGTRQFPVTYMAYPGEQPVISGGRTITGFKPYKDKILQAELPGSRGGKWKIRQLFFNGQRQQRACCPKPDATDHYNKGWAFMEGPAPEDAKSAFKFSTGTLQHNWAKPTEGEVNFFTASGWCNHIIPIKSIDYENHVIELTHQIMQQSGPQWYFDCRFRPDERNRFRIENLLEELNQPGEWCLDSEDGVLYFWPPEDESAESVKVVVPELDRLVDLQSVSNVVFSGFKFTATRNAGDNLHPSDLEGYGAMRPQQDWKYCGDALRMNGCEHCIIENCHFDAVGGNAIYLERYNLHNVIRRNEISDAGANGICMLGNLERHPISNRVEDNHIHHTGAILYYTAGVFLGLSDCNRITHNSIHDMPHHGINLGSNGYGRNIIEYNEIRRTVLECADSGAINCWGDVPDGRHVERYGARAGHFIRWNIISDSMVREKDNDGNLIPKPNGTGIYLDDWSSNCLVSGNIFLRCGIGVLFHSGKCNLVENNIFVSCQCPASRCNGLHLRPGGQDMKDFDVGNSFVGNICYYTHPEAFCTAFENFADRMAGHFDNNIYFHVKNIVCRVAMNHSTDEKIIFGRISLDEWQKMGFDEHSIIADPLFVNPKEEDFRLRPDSPALKLGFQQIDINVIGIRPQQ